MESPLVMLTLNEKTHLTPEVLILALTQPVVELARILAGRIPADQQK